LLADIPVWAGHAHWTLGLPQAQWQLALLSTWALWEKELAGMRVRIKHMREELADRLGKLVPGHDFTYVTTQRGMFSYSGLSKDAVQRLRQEFGVYAVDTGRICVASLNSRNLDYVADAIARVMK
jgi:aromatic-amino-acid transaminase